MSASAFAYLRLLLAATRSIAAYYTCTSPNPVPSLDDQSRYKSRKVSHFGEQGFDLVKAVTLTKYMIHITTAMELTTILATANLCHALPWTKRSDAMFRDILSPGLVLGTLLMVLGTLIRVASYRQLGRHFTFQLSINKDHRLVTDGPYRIVRHPSYIGGLVFFVGIILTQVASASLWRQFSLWTHPVGLMFGGAQLGLLLYVAVVVILRVAKEDDVMREQFKEEWDTWAKCTPYKLIPYVY